MQKIKEILENNKNNSAETKVLNKLDNLVIQYTEAEISINSKNITLSTIIAKLLSDNESVITSTSWLAMLEGGFTNINKMKAGDRSVKVISKAPLVLKIETVSMNSSDFKHHKINLYNQFITELENLMSRYNITCCFDNSLTSLDFFELQDSEEYEKRIEEEKVPNHIINSINSLNISYESVTKNNNYFILILSEEESLTAVKAATENLKRFFSTVSRYEYTLTFGDNL